ncbi:fimbrial protein [Shewanella fidelis]|uniref:Fimbrial protein n=1 Tax=Shewanella fidelis TaxID=173509 RepID=A0AAW8NGJ1_9GAMM|nr:fimbrial protein [Shewanella fidelis]MDR8522464.1 fimbrial protein [Shewanella fidelis]MDW4813002.1 fimbrial protein [Shewanella fidelis]MDW4816739.1 fimbrial protein [Shewanella fidelis]MDW4821009.1 fimbrial protein [Shewanella fidelis]MDW4825456.1 fimbrial protein [Shewanella fidelis]
MKLKPLIVSLSLAAICLSSANVSANSGTIQFTGAITSTTCDMLISSDGVASSNKIVDLGTYVVGDATAVGAFGTAKDIKLTPDLTTCTPAPTDFSSGGLVSVNTGQVDGANGDVIVSADTATTNVGVLFYANTNTPILNQGALDGIVDAGDGSVTFTAQPYAVEATINAGPISGTATFTVAYK